MSSQTNIRNAIFDQRSTRPPEVGVTHTHTHIWTWRLYDQLGPVGPSWWKHHWYSEWEISSFLYRTIEDHPDTLTMLALFPITSHSKPKRRTLNIGHCRLLSVWTKHTTHWVNLFTEIFSKKIIIYILIDPIGSQYIGCIGIDPSTSTTPTQNGCSFSDWIQGYTRIALVAEVFMSPISFSPLTMAFVHSHNLSYHDLLLEQGQGNQCRTPGVIFEE